MKKTILFLLLFAFLCSALLYSCKDKSSNNSDAAASEESIFSEESVPHEISEEVSEPIKSKYKTAVSIGKPYISPEADNGYPDTYGSELTDGLYADGDKGYSDPRWSNYKKPDPVEIIIDLEEVIENLYIFEVSYYHELGPGIATPQSITICFSDDGEVWSKKISFNRHLEGNNEIGAFKLSKELDTYVSARYVKFGMNHYSANLFLDELTIYADVPGEDSSENTKKLIEKAYAEDNYDYSKALSSLSKNKVDFTKDKILLSKSASYSTSVKPSSKHPDTSKLLTDNKPIGSTYESKNWVGYETNDEFELILNLGNVKENISCFEISFFNNSTLNISLPLYVDIYAEVNNEFVKIGRVYSPAKDDLYYFNYSLSLKYSINAQKVKFAVPAQKRSFLLIEEVSVFSYADAVEQPFKSFYKDEPIPVITKEILLSSSDKDYNERKNLIKGLTQTIYSFYPISADRAGNTSESSKLLTDGVYAKKASYSSSEYFKFGGGEGRDIIYNLGATASVDGFKLSFLREDPVGINPVATVMFYLSEDGVNWYHILAGVMPSENPTEFLRFEYKLDKTYKARYARFSFRVWPNAYCDELEVWGTKKVDSNTVSLQKSGKVCSLIDLKSYTPRNEHLGGANDIVLIPNYSGDDEKSGKKDSGYSKEDFIPYVGYISGSGNITDIMFDGFLFCHTGAAVDGGMYYSNANRREMLDKIEKTFAPGRDVDALEQAVAEVKENLKNIDDYKAKFYFALSYPGINVNFGDLDGDGKSDIIKTIEQRIAVVKWEIDEILRHYKNNNYKNIEFAGFYWVHEAMNQNADDEFVINAVSDYCESLGYELFWIPYSKAAGFDQWQFYGFDLACMQPNYAFSATVSKDQIPYTAMLAKRFGMCVEIEICGPALTDHIFFEKYMDYLLGGAEYGYMNETIHIYYQDLYVYLQSCYSEDEKARLIYDYTYDFIKGDLKIKPDKTDDSKVTVGKNTIADLNLNLNKSNAMQYFLTSSTANGNITFNNDGSYTYFPQKDFTGTDSFSYVINNYLGSSEIINVEITVK
ncbi:DUF4855 domain-containing protein [Eubacteriales bacterium OttesenSCG-928-G02]|nr:DUF4855 domain-containing protein [Eubacteriales bacterium OttesenSCG-928-G02]